MARHLDKDPATYSKERDGFIRDLHHFHDTRGTPFRRSPALGGHEVDLYLLYTLVTQQGGWMKVNTRNEWENIFEQFDFPAKCVNSGVALKQIYIRYLDRYEKVHFLGEEADRGSDDDEESRHKRWSARALHSVPLSYNYHQHNIADSTRSYNGLSTTLYKASDYERLALSLISPLPNEQDFAVNVCTLLCNEGKHTLRLDRCPRLVDYLLAHTGVFDHGSMRQVFTEVYSKIRKHSLNHFWYDILETGDVLDLANENNFIGEKKKSADKSSKPSPPSPPYKWRAKHKPQINANKEETKSEATSEGRTEDVTGKAEESQTHKSASESEKLKTNDRIVLSDSDSDCELFASEQTVTKGKGFKLKVEPSDTELFCTGRTLGTQDYVGQRVLQIAHILRNLSFTDDNIPVLASNRTFLRFLLLCVSSRWNSIHQLGLDMLSNIAGELSLKDQNERITECLINFVTNGLHSQDRVMIIACLEILNKLSQREANEDFMSRSLERRAYVQVCSFLTLHDVMLLIYTLECLYALSSLGERACNFIVDVHGIIDTLVSLVTVEGKSYGPKACIGMKLVETVSGVVNAPQVQTPAQQTTQQTLQSAQAVVSSSTPLQVVTPLRTTQAAVPRNIAAASPKAPASPAQATPVQQQPQQTNAGSSSSSGSATPQQLIQQQHAHQQAIQENEQFALAWLRATYEPCGHGRIEQQELYKQYLNSCGKIGRRGVIAPLHFPRCVRSVFGGTVGPNPMKNIDPPSSLLYYEGIRPRIVPLIITLPSAALQHTVHHSKMAAAVQRRKMTTTIAQPIITPLLTTDQSANSANVIDNHAIPSPASPILKAQLSAPPKPRESPTKVDVKSQVLAHPHLSQALLGSNAQNSTGSKDSAASPAGSASSTTGGAGQSSTSLIKSLLATKVNECMLPTHAAPSMRSPTAATPAGAQDSGLQVAQRQQQQRLLAAQQNQQQSTGLQTFTAVNKKVLPKPQPKIEPKSKILRMNGIRVAEAESSGGADSVSSTSQSQDKNYATGVSENHYQPPPAAVISGIGANSAFRGRREPPQPPPPPLAPLSGCTNSRAKTPRMDIEDSDSTGNNSVASSTGISSSNVAISSVSSTEDGENSLTSFEGILLNGIPHSIDIDAPCNDDSNSKDSIRNTKINKPLMLADLLEKKVEKDPPILNGVVCKELRIGDKGLELVDNHINKILNKDNMNNSETNNEVSVIVSSENSDVRTQDVISVCNSDGQSQNELKTGVKRTAEEDISEVDSKKRNVSPSVIVANNLNGVDSPKPESLDSNGDDGNGNVSVSAANLYASLAADVLEDEDEELLMQQDTSASVPVVVDEVPVQQNVQTVQQHVQTQQQVQVMQGTSMQQIITVGQQADQQQLIVTTPRQIIVSQGQIQTGGQQMLITAGGQITLQPNPTGTTIKTASGHQAMPVLVQSSSGTTMSSSIQQRTPVVLSQPGGTPIHLVGSQLQQMQGQYVLQGMPTATGSGAQGQTHYVVTAQPQTALVQGTPQTVLVAQTPQQQGTPTKTIIILQPQTQSVSNAPTHHQKVVVTPQGQQVVVTQVQRPILQSSTVTNNIPPALVSNASTCNSNIKPNQATVITQNTSTVVTMMGSPSKTTSAIIAPKDRISRPQTPIASTSEMVKPATSPSPQPLPPPVVIRDYSNPYICEWRGCTSTKKYKSANEVYMHACEAHVAASASAPGEELQCLWDRCDSMRRKRFSLLTHLHDRHCSPDIMKAVAARRRQLSQTGKTEIAAPAPPPPHPGYAPDAALHAIKRHALEFVNPKELQQKSQVRPGTSAVPVRPGAHPTEQDDNEGPVTKSIRLTASLILRNLVIYSNNSRRYLRHYEPHLAGVALSNVESSRTIAQLLYDMNDSSTSRR